jgi:hypothetical protein
VQKREMARIYISLIALQVIALGVNLMRKAIFVRDSQDLISWE